jgi:hypothetical protein
MEAPDRTSVLRHNIRPSVARFCAPRQPDSIYDSNIIGPGEKMSATNMIKSLQVKDAEPRGMRDSVRPAGGVELVEDLTDVEFGGMDRNVEPPGDLLVRGALGKQC